MNKDLLPSRIDGNKLDRSSDESLFSDSYESTGRRLGNSQTIGPCIMFLATDVASATFNFSNKNMEDGIVDSYPHI